MKIDIITLFPDMFTGPFGESIVKRAQERGLVEINIHNLRKWAKDTRGTVDGRPYGGGVGMLLKVDVVDAALSELKKPNSKVFLLDARGKTYDQKMAKKFSKLDHIILIAGHYEGIDYRVQKYLVDETISIGNYVVTGGEIPAMAIVDSVVRLIPGVLTKEEATEIESFSEPGKVEFPQYTRPEDFRGWKVPKVLLSGNHKEILTWRQKNS